MSAVHRANTWDISDSENESEDIKASSSSLCVTLDQNTSINESNTSPPSTQAEDSSIGADGVKISGRRRREEVLEELEAQERRREEKNKLKEKKLQEQQRRKEAVERLNLLKPENFIKSLTAHIHAGEKQLLLSSCILKSGDGYWWLSYFSLCSAVAGCRL